MRWIKTLILGFFALWAVGCNHTWSYPADYPDEERAEQVSQAMVKISLFPGGHGSGFAIAPTRVITARHVVDDAVGLALGEVMTEDGDVCQVDWVSVARDSDVAAIEVSGCSLTPLVTRSQDTRRGAHVYAMGYPFENGLTWTSGTISNAALNERNEISASVPVLPGNSGGPAVDDYGRVVGVVVAGELAHGILGHRVWGGMTFLVPVSAWPEAWIGS